MKANWRAMIGVLIVATVVRSDPKTEAFARTTIPSSGGTVRNMATTADGRLYLPCSAVNKVAVVEPQCSK